MMDMQEIKAKLLALPGIDGARIDIRIELHCVSPKADLPDDTWCELGKMQTRLQLQGCQVNPLCLVCEQHLPSWGGS